MSQYSHLRRAGTSNVNDVTLHEEHIRDTVTELSKMATEIASLINSTLELTRSMIPSIYEQKAQLVNNKKSTLFRLFYGAPSEDEEYRRQVDLLDSTIQSLIQLMHSVNSLKLSLQLYMDNAESLLVSSCTYR